MSGGDAGVAFLSRHDPGRSTTTTVIGNTGHPLDPLVEVLESLG